MEYSNTLPPFKHGNAGKNPASHFCQHRPESMEVSANPGANPGFCARRGAPQKLLSKRLEGGIMGRNIYIYSRCALHVFRVCVCVRAYV